MYHCTENSGREIREAGNKTPIFRIETPDWVNNGSGSAAEWCFMFLSIFAVSKNIHKWSLRTELGALAKSRRLIYRYRKIFPHPIYRCIFFSTTLRAIFRAQTTAKI